MVKEREMKSEERGKRDGKRVEIGRQKGSEKDRVRRERERERNRDRVVRRGRWKKRRYESH